jgi:hypothetical protein
LGVNPFINGLFMRNTTLIPKLLDSRKEELHQYLACNRRPQLTLSGWCVSGIAGVVVYGMGNYYNYEATKSQLQTRPITSVANCWTNPQPSASLEESDPLKEQRSTWIVRNRSGQLSCPKGSKWSEAKIPSQITTPLPSNLASQVATAQLLTPVNALGWLAALSGGLASVSGLVKHEFQRRVAATKQLSAPLESMPTLLPPLKPLRPIMPQPGEQFEFQPPTSWETNKY